MDIDTIGGVENQIHYINKLIAHNESVPDDKQDKQILTLLRYIRMLLVDRKEMMSQQVQQSTLKVAKLNDEACSMLNQILALEDVHSKQ